LGTLGTSQKPGQEQSKWVWGEDNKDKNHFWIPRKVPSSSLIPTICKGKNSCVQDTKEMAQECCLRIPGEGCKVEIVYRDVMVCAWLGKVREACVKSSKFFLLNTSSWQICMFALCMGHNVQKTCNILVLVH
jgi:hypothetical protein